MTALELTCGGCGLRIRADRSQMGKRGRCSKCGHVLTVDPGATQAASSTAAAGPDPADRLEELAAQLERIPLPRTLVKSLGGQTPSSALIKLRRRLRDAAGWLRGGKDILGLTHCRSNVGRILSGTVEDCCGDKQWSAAVRSAVGPKVWPEILDILKNVNLLAVSLQEDGG